MLTRYTLCLILTLRASAAVAANDVFKVVDASPPAYMLAPFRSEWRKIAPGDELGDGDIVQVGVGGRLVVSTRNVAAATGLDAEAMRLTMSEPTIVRLGPDLFREVDRRRLIAPPPQPAGASDHEEPHLVFDLLDAWYRRVTLAYRRRSDASARLLGGVTLATHAKPISVYMPQPDSLMLSDTYPYELRVLWRYDAKDQRAASSYEVWVWIADAEIGGAQVVTREMSAVVTLPREGRYYLQVRTREGDAQSRPIPFHVVRPISIVEFPKPPGKKVKLDYSKLVLSHPSDGLTVVSSARTMALDFVWRVIDPDERRARHRLRVFDATGKGVVDEATEATQARVLLPATGRYTWRVESFMEPLNARGTVGTARSETRSISFMKPSPLVDAVGLFRNKGEVTVVVDAL